MYCPFVLPIFYSFLSSMGQSLNVCGVCCARGIVTFSIRPQKKRKLKFYYLFDLAPLLYTNFSLSLSLISRFLPYPQKLTSHFSIVVDICCFCVFFFVLSFSTVSIQLKPLNTGWELKFSYNF